MPAKYEIIIVVPCYNEGKKFLIADYHTFIEKNNDTLICFVNDGSKDNTLEILQKIKKQNPTQVEIVSYTRNVGKAEAVRKGVLFCNDNFEFSKIGFLDADLAVSLEEFKDLGKNINEKIVFCFGSRIARIGSVIERKKSRFIVGRIIATLISNILSVKVYDTQCGCKLFDRQIVVQIFYQKFMSKWLFDVEIFFRIIKMFGRSEALEKTLEVPLLKWIDRGDSKVKVTYFFKLFMDLYQIKNYYRRN